MHHGKAAHLATQTAFTVALRLMECVYCTPSDNRLLWNILKLYRFVTKNPMGYLLARHV